MTVPSAICGRAREWISCELDGELSQFERAFLESHTRRCATCARLRDEYAQITHSLRTAPLVPLEQPVTLPPRRLLIRRHVVSTAAAAAAFVVAAVIAVGTSVEPFAPSDDRVRGSYPAVSMNEDALVRSVQRRSWRANPLALTIARRLELERV